MFEHFLAGELVFLIIGYYLGFDVTPTFLMFGAFCGFLPDLLSYFLNKRVNYGRWYHSHRDNFSHSLFLPLLVFFAIAFWLGWKMSLLIALAIMTHPLLDLYGIGWGVKLFLPLSDNIYKAFYHKKVIYTFDNDEERNKKIKKHQTDDWVKKIYFQPWKVLSFPKKSQIEMMRRNLPAGRKEFFLPWIVWSVPRWWGIMEWLSLFAAIWFIVRLM
jgi:hypothetical protein